MTVTVLFMRRNKAGLGEKYSLVFRRDPTDLEVFCSCFTFATLAATLNDRMSCFEPSVMGYFSGHQ